jgi:nucleotide-binding universal stress UspA family protein
MTGQLLHVFRNTPFGRETLMQSAFFCQRIGGELSIYIPQYPQFLMYFDYGVVTVDLDRSFLRAPETARAHASEIASSFSVSHRFFEPSRFTVPELPDLPVDYSYMCCPRSISDLSSKIGLGHIGSRVRSIVQKAGFPVLVPSSAFKQWNSIVCFFGGSANALVALQCARGLSELSATPMRIFTQAEETKPFYEQGLQSISVLESIEAGDTEWLYFEAGDLRENLYAVPHDALVVVGAYGHGVARELFFGSKMELIQTVLPNPMLIVGPGCGS